jgi:predicted TIM-barrel fold metal-dependent hydrolase
VEQRFETVAGIRGHARVGGTGPPIVLVHGLAVSSLYFVPLARRLTRRYAVLAPDLPGYGRSATPPRPLGIAELADALRARTSDPRVVKNQDGVEVLTTRMGGQEPLATAFDEVDFHLARMNRQGVSTSVLSLLGSFCWIESQPLDVSLPLCRLFNDSVSRLCQEHEGRFVAYAALPLVDMSAAAAEFERALGLPRPCGRRSKVYVDCNSFGPRAIEAAVSLYGADRIVCGTDGTEFGCEWTSKALAEAQIGEDAREKILHGNAAAMLSPLAPLAPREPAAA